MKLKCIVVAFVLALLARGEMVAAAVPAAPMAALQGSGGSMAPVPGQLTLAWNANDPAQSVNDYIVYVGTVSGTYSQTFDAGNVTQYAVTGLTPGVTYYFALQAKNTAGQVSPLSLEVNGPAPGIGSALDPNCNYPLGAKSVSIFTVGKIVYSNPASGGGGVAGSRAYLLFQVSSPGSPVTHISVQTGGVSLSPNDDQSATGPGDRITSSPGQWFTLPPAGSYPLSILGSNLYGCSHVQATGLTLLTK